MKVANAILTILCSLICGAFLACTREEPYQSPPQTTVFPEKLQATTVKVTKIPIFYEAVGTITAKTSTVLASKIPGHIKHIKVREGTRVKSGDLLVVIDDRDVKARLGQARAAHSSARESLNEIQQGIRQAKAQKKQSEANLALAQATYRRYEKLYKDKVISDHEFDTVKAKLKVAEAQVTAAQEGVSQLISKQQQVQASIEQAESAVEEANAIQSYSRIHAPFDGVIIKKHVGVGSLAVPGLPLLVIENPKGFRLEVDVREREFANKVKIGRDVDVQIDALGNRFLAGKVAEVVPSANRMSRTFQVKIALPDLEGIKSGMYGKALCLREEQEAVMVPKSALIQRGQLEQIFSVDGNQIARLRLVKTGKRFQDRIEILSGLREGDVIITNPQEGLKDRQKVNVEVEG